MREKLSKWFKSFNKPLRYSFFCSVKGLKNEFFQPKWKISLRVMGRRKNLTHADRGGVHKNLIIADGGQGGSKMARKMLTS